MLEGDPIATAQFAELAFPLLLSDMRARHRGVGDEEVFDACADAVLTICRVPERWEPAKSKLRTFLWMVATGDLRNELERRKPQQAFERVMDPVELAEFRRNIPAEAEISEGDMNALVGQYEHLLADDGDRAVFRLMAVGERDETQYSVVLGVSLLPAPERKQRVKQAKDRIKKRLQRANVSWPTE